MPADHRGENPYTFNKGGADDEWDKYGRLNFREMAYNSAQYADLFAIIRFNFVGKEKIESQDGDGDFNADT